MLWQMLKEAGCTKWRVNQELMKRYHQVGMGRYARVVGWLVGFHISIWQCWNEKSHLLADTVNLRSCLLSTNMKKLIGRSRNCVRVRICMCVFCLILVICIKHWITRLYKISLKYCIWKGSQAFKQCLGEIRVEYLGIQIIIVHLKDEVRPMGLKFFMEKYIVKPTLCLTLHWYRPATLCLATHWYRLPTLSCDALVQTANNTLMHMLTKKHSAPVGQCPLWDGDWHVCCFSPLAVLREATSPCLASGISWCQASCYASCCATTTTRSRPLARRWGPATCRAACSVSPISIAHSSDTSLVRAEGEAVSVRVWWGMVTGHARRHYKKE